MENFEPEKKDLLSGQSVEVDQQTGMEWKQAASWARAIGILCMIGLGFVFFALLVALLFGSSRSMNLGVSYMVGLIIGCMLICGVGVVWILNLMRFSNGTITAVTHMDQQAFEKSMEALKIFFIISGVISILAAFFTLINLLVN